MKEEFISMSQAATLAGVTSQTMRNLCKARVLRYKKKRTSFYVSRSDVLEYAEQIGQIYEAKESITKLRDKVQAEKAELINTYEEVRHRLEYINMFPLRILAIEKTLMSVIQHFQHDLNDDCYLTKRDFDMLKDFLLGYTTDSMTRNYHLTRASISAAWTKALRKFARTKNEIERLKKERESLEEQINMQALEISRLHDTLEGKESIEYDEAVSMSKLLDSKIADQDLSKRALNVLKYAEIETIRDLVSYHRRDLLRWRNFGKKSLTELDEFLEERGLCFGMDISHYPKLGA